MLVILQDLKLALDALQGRVSPLDRLVHAFASTLKPPVLDQARGGFFYREPGLHHFCLLKAARIVSGLRAAIELAKGGFTQEIGVVLRTVIECSNHIQFVLVGIEYGPIPVEAKKLVSDYFKDNERRTIPPRSTQIRQKDLHDAIGADLDRFQDVAAEGSRSTTEMLSNIYLRYSYFVHARYPETMDLYGGNPGRFHLNGMMGTRKDIENIQVLDSQITSASLCFTGMVQGLRYLRS